MSLVDTFFVTKTGEIDVDGKRLPVRKAKGGQDIYLDELGRFILGRWQPKPEPKTTPLQRSRDPWPAELKGYIVYPRGLASAWRSRQLAMFGAWKVRIPPLNEVSKLLQEEIRIERSRREKLSPKIQAKLWKSGYLFVRAEKPELREAHKKIIFLYRDLQDAVNIGAALARTTAITDRLRERLEGIYGWLAVYSGQSGFLNVMQKSVDKIFDRMEHTLRAMQKHSFFRDQFIAKSQMGNLLAAVWLLEMEVENLKPFRPYRAWAKMMGLDLIAVSGAIKSREFATGKHFLQRILVSFQVKRQQRHMDKFLFELSKGQILNKWKSIFDYWLERTILSFKWLQQEEEQAKFREPVCEKFIDFVIEAKEALKNGASIAAIAKPLKDAYFLL